MTTLARWGEFSVSVAPNGCVAFVHPHGELELGTAPCSSSPFSRWRPMTCWCSTCET